MPFPRVIGRGIYNRLWHKTEGEMQVESSNPLNLSSMERISMYQDLTVKTSLLQYPLKLKMNPLETLY